MVVALTGSTDSTGSMVVALTGSTDSTGSMVVALTGSTDSTGSMVVALTDSTEAALIGSVVVELSGVPSPKASRSGSGDVSGSPVNPSGSVCGVLAAMSASRTCAGE